MGNRLNWASRQSPGDFDNSVPVEIDYSFDYRRNTEPGKPSWPERHGPDRFGPALIGKSWKAGLVVVAQIDGLPHPVAAIETRWSNGVLVVKVSGSWCVPDRLWTRKTVKGLDSTGLLTGE